MRMSESITFILVIVNPDRDPGQKSATKGKSGLGPAIMQRLGCGRGESERRAGGSQKQERVRGHEDKIEEG